jgi:DNA-binding transcriptional LysR family regulator
MDRLKALEIFKAVAERQSFVKAAEALELSNAVVSRTVQDLERLLGARLLQRTTRRVSLTAEGDRVLQRARELLGSFEELTATATAGAAEMAGEIRVAVPASFGAPCAAPVIAEFLARHPQLRITLRLSDAPLDLVDRGLDLALRVAWDDELPPSLIARRIGELRVGVYAAPAYLQFRGTPKHPDDLARHDCLVHAARSRDARWRFVHPVSQQVIDLPIDAKLCANQAEALMIAAVHGAGLVLLPTMLAEPAVARRELQPVLSHWAAPALGVYLTYASRRHLPLRVRKLIDHLAEALPLPAGSDAVPLPGPAQAMRA